MSPARAAARIADQTDHGGVLAGPGVPSVLIEGMAAAVAADPAATLHTCAIPPQPPHPPGPMAGTGAVLVGGRPLLRDGDVAPCGARLLRPAGTVQIGDG